MIQRTAFAAALCVAVLATPAEARQESFTATLRGDNVTTHTGSAATGSAHILVDTIAGTVSVEIDVDGITTDGLWDQLVAAPIGPIHLHAYPTHDHTNYDAAQLAFPVPFGPAYTATSTGFRVRLEKASYAAGAATLKSTTTLADFVTAMEQGHVVLNVHTDKFNDGEISGEVVPAGRRHAMHRG